MRVSSSPLSLIPSALLHLLCPLSVQYCWKTMRCHCRFLNLLGSCSSLRRDQQDAVATEQLCQSERVQTSHRDEILCLPSLCISGLCPCIGSKNDNGWWFLIWEVDANALLWHHCETTLVEPLFLRVYHVHQIVQEKAISVGIHFPVGSYFHLKSSFKLRNRILFSFMVLKKNQNLHYNWLQ